MYEEAPGTVDDGAVPLCHFREKLLAGRCGGLAHGSEPERPLGVGIGEEMGYCMVARCEAKDFEASLQRSG